MRFYSFIIPVYNRPQEVAELLDSLSRQTYRHFEVLIVEDGSTLPCKEVTAAYSRQLDIRYFAKPNSGQGLSRNYGFARAKGDYLIVLDSDCLLPPHYLQAVEDHLNREPLDAFGGPDRAHDSFTPVQKAINYAMTSVLSTGGIRGRRKQAGPYHPRSFNMGISRQVYEQTGGYILPRKGEDIEFSIRIIKQGFKVGLIEDAYVYHKRRTSLRQFFRQLHFFGRARINVGRYHPGEIRLVHLFPLFFLAGLLAIPLLWLWQPQLGQVLAAGYGLYLVLIGVHATWQNRSVRVGLLAVVAVVMMLVAYALGMVQEVLGGKG